MGDKVMTNKKINYLFNKRGFLIDVIRTAKNVDPEELDGYQLFMLADVKQSLKEVEKKLGKKLLRRYA